MKDQFLRLYQYNLWANNLFSETLANSSFKNEKVSVLFSHTAAAQLIWLNRLSKLDVKIPDVWEVMPLPEAIDSLRTGGTLWLEYLEKQSDFEQIISYQNTKGTAFETPLKDIVVHVANHGTHHRGQIATLLRAENIAPPASDFIFFSRNN